MKFDGILLESMYIWMLEYFVIEMVIQYLNLNILMKKKKDLVVLIQPTKEEPEKEEPEKEEPEKEEPIKEAHAKAPIFSFFEFAFCHFY